MLKVFAWCDSPTAPTGFGRSANHVLHALHETGRYEITQLAVNFETSTRDAVPWEIHAPRGQHGDPYGLEDIGQLFRNRQFDMVWTTFDPEVPWRYAVPGTDPAMDALGLLRAQKERNPTMRIAGWFPVDGGPLSDYELAVLGLDAVIDKPVTMSPHVYELIRWTMQLRKRIPQGQRFDLTKLQERLEVVPHGVDIDHYRIPTAEEKAAAKVRLGFAPDSFVILQLERNQQRKQNYLGLSVLERLRRMLPPGIDPRKVVLFQHMLPDEDNHGCRLGFDLPELSWRYGLEAGVDVRWPNGFTEESVLINTVYAGADAFLSVSTGEGFQYPAWEALACGIPLVVPDADARAAWFGNGAAPNVHLYDARPDSIVMRGGYGRRMALPDPSAAAGVLRRMLMGKAKYKPQSEAGRAWVARTANVQDVKNRWVAIMDEQAEGLAADRKRRHLPVPGQRVDYRVEMLENPGLGDLVAAMPALRALRERGTVGLVLPRAHLGLASLFDCADVYIPRASTNLLMDAESENRYVLTDLYYPERAPEWLDPRRPRQEVIAERVGLTPEDLKPFRVTLPERLLEESKVRFLDTFGVTPGTCVGLAFQSGSPDRAIPDLLLPQMLPSLKTIGATPVLLGTRAMGVNYVHVADLTGRTQLEFLLAILAQLAAVVTTDSAIAHFAGALGTPAVVAFTTVAPESRLKYYSGPIATVVPEDPDYPAGVVHNFGVGYFARTITAGRLSAALEGLLGVGAGAAPEVVVTLPEEEGTDGHS